MKITSEAKRGEHICVLIGSPGGTPKNDRQPYGDVWGSFFNSPSKASDDFLEDRGSQHQPERDPL